MIRATRFSSIVCMLVLACCVNVVCGQSKGKSGSAASDAEKLEGLLFDLPDVRFERIKSDKGEVKFMLEIRQHADHADEASPTFSQRVYVLHRGFDKPTVINTNGYNLEQRKHELVEMLDANFVSVEHRFFGPSTPQPRKWQHLTIQQAAGDYHHVRELLGKIYQKDWVSTGISKGGETCTYYRFFHPDDVVATVPYVAPFPQGLKDQRFYKFLDTTGTKQCRDKIYQYQLNVLKNKDQLVPRLKYYLKGRKASMDLIGGPEAALELIALEYPFAFWQGGKNEDDIPPADATPDMLLDHLIDNGDLWYLLDASTENLAAHYYQHATQLGYYGYRAERFGDLISKWGSEPSACFFPYKDDLKVTDLKFDPATSRKLNQWIKTDAENVFFLYGAIDTWTVAQAQPDTNGKVHKYIFEGKHHGNARLGQVEESLRNEILGKVKGLLTK